MLPRRHRLTSSRTFATAVRTGRRIRSGSVVGHLLLETEDGPTRAGLIVSKGIGNSVQRHRVSRILRHAVGEHLTDLPTGSVLVLRALPGAAARDSRLGGDVATIVRRAREP